MPQFTQKRKFRIAIPIPNLTIGNDNTVTKMISKIIEINLIKDFMAFPHLIEVSL